MNYRCIVTQLNKQCGSRRDLRFVLRKSSQDASTGTRVSAVLTERVTFIMNYFDRVLGIAEVRAAQSVVTAAEDEFMKSRRHVQESRTTLAQLQSQLRELRSKLDRIAREDERYLVLATEEHRVLIDEKRLKTDLEAFVALERDHFAALSGAVRTAHEKERSRAERTKYWSIIGSACGAVLGILGSTILNIKRMRQIKLTVEENNQAFITKTLDEFRTIVQSDNVISSSSHGNKTVSRDQERNDDVMMTSLLENQRLLGEICEKMENFLEPELASLLEQLKLELLSAKEGHYWPNKITQPQSEATGLSLGSKSGDFFNLETGILFIAGCLSGSLLYFLSR